MTAQYPVFLRPRCLGLLVVSMLWLARPAGILAEDIKVEALLVWGTNEQESKKPDHKPVDSKTAKKLRKVFTWKNYFLEKQVVAAVASGQTQKVELSPECTVQIREGNGSQVEVQLIGKGEPVSKASKSFNKGEWIVIGGDDRNECAWFVILKRL